MIVVEGAAGIGKSSLLAAAGRSAEAQGATVLSARAGPLEQDAAWGVARQLFAPLQREATWGELTRGAAGLAGRVLHPETPEPALTGDAMHAAAHGLEYLAANLADLAPTVLLVDDVHWADAPSLRWLAQLAGRLEELRLAVVCAVRSGEPPSQPDLLAELLAAAPEGPLRPRALGPAAAEALVREGLPSAEPSFAHACHAVTAGNPFLLGALIRQLASEQIAPTDHVAAGLSSFGPEQVARSLERQLARLPDGSAGLARAVAVLGGGTPVRHAACLARLDPEDAAVSADALRAAGLLEGTGELSLTHPLVAGALRASFGAGELAQWHGRAASMLAAEGADPERVALHVLRTDPAADPETVGVLRAAAERAPSAALPRAQRRSCAGRWRSRLSPPRSAPTSASSSGWRSPRTSCPTRASCSSRRWSSPRRRISASRSRCAAAARWGWPGTSTRRWTSAGAGWSTPPTSRPTPSSASRRSSSASRPCKRLHGRGARAAAASRRPADDRALATECGRVRLVRRREPAADALAMMRPLLESGGLASEPDSLLNTVATLVLIQCDEIEAAYAGCTALIELARPRGWLIALHHGSFLRAIALVRAGRVREAEADARLSFDFKLRHSALHALLWSLYPLVDALTETDQPESADAALAAAGVADLPEGALTSPLLLQSRARLRLSQHRPPRPSRTPGRGRALGGVRVRPSGFASWHADAAEALVALGEPAEARRHAETHLALAERLGLPGPIGAGLRAVARTADRGERVVLLERAACVLADSPAQLEHTRVLVDLGAALRRANRRADAREPLRRALDLAERHGMRLLAGRARDELHAAGARPRRAALKGPHALTAAEHRVARLAAEGHSNREIAEQLYVTQRTVETHLTHVFAKLDIRARAELAMALTRSDGATREPAPA